MKTEFDLMVPNPSGDRASGFTIKIIGKEPNNKPYVAIDFMHHNGVYIIPDKDLERFAVNILKALKSDKLK